MFTEQRNDFGIGFGESAADLDLSVAPGNFFDTQVGPATVASGASEIWDSFTYMPAPVMDQSTFDNFGLHDTAFGHKDDNGGEAHSDLDGLASLTQSRRPSGESGNMSAPPAAFGRHESAAGAQDLAFESAFQTS